MRKTENLTNDEIFVLIFSMFFPVFIKTKKSIIVQAKYFSRDYESNIKEIMIRENDQIKEFGSFSYEENGNDIFEIPLKFEFELDAIMSNEFGINQHKIVINKLNISYEKEDKRERVSYLTKKR